MTTVWITFLEWFASISALVAVFLTVTQMQGNRTHHAALHYIGQCDVALREPQFSNPELGKLDLRDKTFDGKKAASMGMINEAVPLAKLKKRVTDLAKVLLDKNPTTLRQAKHACKRIIDMDWDASEDYLFAKIDQMRFLDPEEGRQRAMRQFLDEKTYRPGLGNYKRED